VIKFDTLPQKSQEEVIKVLMSLDDLEVVNIEEDENE
jgi:hypothetical protein